MVRPKQFVEQPAGVARLREQEGLFDDFADGDHFELRQRIFRTDHQHQLVPENGLNLQTRRLNGKGEDTHLNLPVFELLHDLVAKIAVNADLHRGIATAIFSEYFGQNVQAGRLVGADAQGSTWRATVVGDGREGFVPEILQSLSIFVENLACGSKFHRLSGAIQEPVPIFLFQLPDLRADRRLRAEYLFAGAGETPLPGYFQKGDELIEVHR